MKANYGARFCVGLSESGAVPLNAKGERIAQMVWTEAQRQFDIEKEYVTEAVLSAVLCALHNRYRWKGATLERVYKEAVELIAGMRFDLCEDHKRRKFGELGEELVAMMEQLRVNGCDLKKLEAACQYDIDTGEVRWEGENEAEAR